MNKRTKKLLSAGIILSGLVLTPVVFAQSNNAVTAGKPAQHKMIQSKYQFAKTLTISSVNGNTITAIDKAGNSYTVDASQAKEERKFKGASKLSEMSVSDKILVMGDINGTNVTAKVIRDLSIHAKNSAMMGQVTAISSGSFTISSLKGKTFTVNVDGSTKFAGPKTHALNALADLKVGDHVLVTGIMDNATKVETAKIVRYFDPGNIKQALGKKMPKSNAAGSATVQ